MYVIRAYNKATCAFCSVAPRANDSAPQLEGDSDVFCHQNLFSIFLKIIVTDALANYKGNVNIGGRVIVKISFIDDIAEIAVRKAQRTG